MQLDEPTARALVESWTPRTVAFLRTHHKLVRDEDGGRWGNTSREINLPDREWRERMIAVLTGQAD